MKKAIPGVIVIVAFVAAGAFVYLKKTTGAQTRATELAPAETIFFAHLPDLRRSAERWPKTGLAQIGAEKEMQDFLAKPRAAAPQLKLWDEKLVQLARIQPGEAFVAVTSIDGPAPRFVAGVSFSGRKAELQALLAEPRAELKRAYPAGRSEIATHAGVEIETFTYGDKMLGEAIRDGWYLVANDPALLRSTIDAVPHGLGPKAIAASELFQKATRRLPADGEAVLYAQVGVLSERLVSLLVASGQTLDPKQVADLKKVQAIAWGTKFDGAQMRDTLFVLSPGNEAEPPLAKSTLAFSTPQTFLTYAAALPTTMELPEQSLALGAFIPGFAALEKALADRELKLADFGKTFGREFGAVLSWPEGSPQPSAVLAMEVRDGAKAKGFVEAFTSGLAGSPAWGRQEKDGVAIFQSPAAPGLIAVTPSLALTDRFLVLGFSQPEIAAALERLKSGQLAITQTATFGQATQAVTEPTSGFGYLDLKTLFERSYGTLRPFLAMTLAFSPDSAKYLDAGKLPSTETIAKHLSPSVYSQSVSPEGTLIESVGTLTFNQVLVGTVGGAVAAAFPMIESALGSGMTLDPNLLLNPGAPKPAAPAPQKAPAPEADPAPAPPADPVPGPVPAPVQL